jgi:hypothetical protein
MRTASARKHLTKIAATVALVAGAATVAGVGTFGAYTDTTTGETAVSSGKVSVLMNGSEAGIKATAAKMVPGDKVVFPITVTRGADSTELGDLTLTTTITDNNALTSALRVSVDTCTQPWTATMTCPGSATNLLTDGTISAMTSVGGWAQPIGWITQLNNDSPVYVRATLSLPATAPSTTAGLSTTITWNLTGTQRAGKTTVVDPTTLS